MKKLLLIILLSTPFTGFSQTAKPIDGFLGIKFGSSKADVLAAMKAKGGVFDKTNSNDDHFSFFNVKLGHRMVANFFVAFVNGQAFEADYLFNVDLQADVPGFYTDLVNDLTAVYGQGKPTQKYTPPYKEADGNLLAGLAAGKIDYHTLWVDGSKNYIRAFIVPQMVVELTYQDDALATLFRAQQKTKEKGDF